MLLLISIIFGLYFIYQVWIFDNRKMAKSPEGLKASIRGLSFLDWDGLTGDEVQRLDTIINQSSCAAVKLPFSPKKQEAVPKQTMCNIGKQLKFPDEAVNSSITTISDTGSNGQQGLVFQPNIPPPAVPPVVAYPIPVPHWAQGAPPPPPGHPPPPHFPLTHMQGGYVFQNQPPPLVTNAEAATIAFVAAMSSGQPLYAIPGVPMQSIHHGHYPPPHPGGYPQSEAMDLSALAATQQPVTIPHFVPSDHGVVFSQHPTHVPLAQAPPPHVIPVTTGAYPIHVHDTSYMNGVHEHMSPHNQYHLLPNAPPPPDSHIVYMPHEDKPFTSGIMQEPNTTVNSDRNKINVSPSESSPVAGKMSLPAPHTNGGHNITEHNPPPSSTEVEFVGPIVFNPETDKTHSLPSKPVQANKPIVNNNNSEKGVSETTAVSVSCSNNNKSRMQDNNNKQKQESVKVLPPSTPEPTNIPSKAAKQSAAPPSNTPSQSATTNDKKVVTKNGGDEKTAELKPTTKLSSAEDKNSATSTTQTSADIADNKSSPQAESVKDSSKDRPAPTPAHAPAAPKMMWSSLFGKSKAAPSTATTINTAGSATSSCPVSPVSPGSVNNSTPAMPVAAPSTDQVRSVRYWQEREQAESALRNYVPPSQKVVPVRTQNDPLAPKILHMLSNLPVIHTPIVIQPRGLVNGSNVCFMNATLQVLMGCPPFIHLFRAFKNLPSRQGNGSCTPIFDSLVEFVNSFQNGQRIKPQRSRNKKGGYVDVSVGQPFSPASLLNVAQDILGLRIGIQHDAEEFLSKILMICHEELENIMKLNQSNVLNNNSDKAAVSNGYSVVSPSVEDELDEDDSWQKVGPKNHSVETNVNDCGQTPLSSIFSGLSRSCLTRETGKNSDTLDSFFTLKLDIQGDVCSVADALQRLNVSEILHDIDGGKIQGQRRMFFDVLPPVLIMHLKLFQYSEGNGKKIQKKIDFDVDLTIPKETLSRVGKVKYASLKSRSYKLFGVVNHHGLKMNDGHYTSDVYLSVASGWLRFDDSDVYAIHEKQVLQHSDRHMPYLLFYRRLDVVS